MKVYIATYYETADSISIIGVYATEELAKQQEKFYKGKMFIITEYEIITE